MLTTDPVETPELAQRVRNAEWMSAPSLIDYEVLNVLRKLILRRVIDLELAEDCRRALRALRLERYPMNDELSIACGSYRRTPPPTMPLS